MISQYVLKTYTIPYNHQPIYIYIYIYWYNPNIDIVPIYIYIYILIYIYISSHLPNPATSHVAPPQAVEGGPAAFVHDGPRAPKACCGSHRKKTLRSIGKSSEFHGISPYHHHIIKQTGDFCEISGEKWEFMGKIEMRKYNWMAGWRFIAGKMIELNGWFWPSLIPGRKYGTVTGNYHLQFTMAKVIGNSRSVRGLVHLSLSKN